MARSAEATKKAKAAYSRRYRKTARGKAQTRAYNKKTVKERASRNKARAELASKLGKKAIEGKDVHHKDGNPENNNSTNLKVAKKHHEGGVFGNKNAKKSNKKTTRKRR